jgi:hypothetical protein
MVIFVPPEMYTVVIDISQYANIFPFNKFLLLVFFLCDCLFVMIIIVCVMIMSYRDKLFDIEVCSRVLGGGVHRLHAVFLR